MKQLQDVLIQQDVSIMQAIDHLNATALQILLVVDGDGKLLGSVTDGDMRRGILQSLDLQGSVTSVMNISPATVRVGTSRASVLVLMRSKEIHCIPVLDATGCVVALETETHLLWHGLEESWVVLMAGGLGTRLRPLTEDLPKPMLPIHGKPILEKILGHFLEQGFRRFFFSVNYRAEMITDYFGDGSKLGCKISYLHESQRLGTAGALSLLPTQDAPPQIVVMNGDLLTSVDFRRLLDYHQRAKTHATMCVRDYSIRVPYGVVDVEHGLFRSIQEKPAHQYYVNAGIYAINSTMLSSVPQEKYYEMTDFFQQMVADGLPVGVFPMCENWLDIGNMETYQRANALAEKGML